MTTRPRIGCVRVFDVVTESGPASVHVLLFEDLTRGAVDAAVAAFERSAAVASDCGDATRLVRPRSDLLANLVDRPSGATLAARLEQGGRVPSDEALHVLTDLASTLSRIHAAGLVDGSLSGERVWCDASRTRLELPGVGSISAAATTPADDVHALGRLACRLLTGSRADEAAEAEEADLTPLAALHPDLPTGLADLLTRCLAADPAARPTAAELDRFFQLLVVPPPSARRRHLEAEAAFRERRRER